MPRLLIPRVSVYMLLRNGIIFWARSQCSLFANKDAQGTDLTMCAGFDNKERPMLTEGRKDGKILCWIKCQMTHGR